MAVGDDPAGGNARGSGHSRDYMDRRAAPPRGHVCPGDNRVLRGAGTTYVVYTISLSEWTVDPTRARAIFAP